MRTARRLILALALGLAAASSWYDAFGRLHVVAGGVESVYQWVPYAGWQLLYSTAAPAGGLSPY